VLKNIFPSSDDVFGSMTKDCMMNIANQTMLEEPFHLQRKKN